MALWVVMVEIKIGFAILILLMGLQFGFLLQVSFQFCVVVCILV